MDGLRQFFETKIFPTKNLIDQGDYKLNQLGNIDVLEIKSLLSAKMIYAHESGIDGAWTEQFVAQELASFGIELYYYSAENSSGEVDFVIQSVNKVLPLEVKAEENLQAKSLHALCRKYGLPDALRSSMSGYREQDWMVNVPLYILRRYLEQIC